MKSEYYYFTFGYGQPHAGHYVKIKGDYGTARMKMFDRYGNRWCFQYSEEEWMGMLNDPHRNWSMEIELEVIE